MNDNTIAIIGIIATLIISSISLYLTIRNSKKTTFINSITSSRIKYIQDLRNIISEYCGLFYRYGVLLKANPNLSTEKLEVLRSIDKLKYQIQLFLNPEDELWDKKIVQLVNNARMHLDDDPANYVQELIEISQYLFKLEWEGAKLESIKGPISKKEKLDLSKKIFAKYNSKNKSDE